MGNLFFIAHNGFKYIVVLMQYICCYKYVKQKLYKLKKNKIMKTLLSRVEEESVNYATAEHAAIDHLKMASAHLFEETEGRDVDSLLSDIEKIIQKLENRINS